MLYLLYKVYALYVLYVLCAVCAVLLGHGTFNIVSSNSSSNHAFTLVLSPFNNHFNYVLVS